jgi:cell division protein FtsZ
MKFEFVDQKERYNAKIKVLGVGGAGGNAINNMINAKLKGVDFVAANTDCQDLDRSFCPCKLQLGPSVTMGLGAGADPEIGRLSAEESINEIRELVAGGDMAFITAGMGGGTGTGAAPIIARECKESGALTVAVVTKPFKFEGERRMKRAMEGIERLKNEVDSLIIIPNERLKTLGGEGTTFKELIGRADEVLLQAVKGISDLILSSGFINLDFADVRKVMEQMGTAIMGMGWARGENRAAEAAQMAINSPLLEDISISGAKGVLLNISGPTTMTMDEIDEASNYIKEEVSPDAEIFWGVVFDEDVEDEVRVTVIATGIDGDSDAYDRIYREEYKNVVKIRDVTEEDTQEEWTVRMKGEILDTPTFQRKGAGTTHPEPSDDEQRERKRRILSKFRFKEDLDYPTFLRAKAD